MKALHKIMEEVVKLTTLIETNYPELYKFLDETPISIGNHPEKEVTVHDLSNYLNTLKVQLEDYLKTHKKV